MKLTLVFVLAGTGLAFGLGWDLLGHRRSPARQAATSSEPVVGTADTDGVEGPVSAPHTGRHRERSLVGGVDGCRGGWVLVTAPIDGAGPSTLEVVSDFKDVVVALEEGWLTVAAVDIPIGLPERQARRCDIDARSLIGPRRSSVFPAPLRGVLGSASYEEAAERSRELSGKGLSRQSFSILPKIESVDVLMTPDLQYSLVEVHPEVSFTMLSGRPMGHHKATPQGRMERLSALAASFSDIEEHLARRLGGARPDDVIDAFVAAWSARRWVTGTYRRLGGELDRRGLRMEIIA